MLEAEAGVRVEVVDAQRAPAEPRERRPGAHPGLHPVGGVQLPRQPLGLHQVVVRPPGLREGVAQPPQVQVRQARDVPERRGVRERQVGAHAEAGRAPRTPPGGRTPRSAPSRRPPPGPPRQTPRRPPPPRGPPPVPRAGRTGRRGGRRRGRGARRTARRPAVRAPGRCGGAGACGGTVASAPCGSLGCRGWTRRACSPRTCGGRPAGRSRSASGPSLRSRSGPTNYDSVVPALTRWDGVRQRQRGHRDRGVPRTECGSECEGE